MNPRTLLVAAALGLLAWAAFGLVVYIAWVLA